MRSFTYPATLAPEDGGKFTVRFTDLPEAITSGDDRPDALRQATDCLEEAVAGRIADGLEIPPPSRVRKASLLVTLPALMAAKACLYLVMQDSGMTQIQLAQRLGVDEKEIRRMLDPRHPTKLSRIERAIGAFGKRLVVSLDTGAA